MKATFPRLFRFIPLLALLPGFSNVVYAEDEQMEEVVVTGSLIKGTPVDAALPVEVFSAADLEDVGAPTAVEFVKSLTISGPTTGETYYFGGQSGGYVGYNIRGIGADKSLTLFNGRRFNENANTIPGNALSRIEILKDGAAVTYGADATGGVVNYITQTDFEGVEVNSSYKAISGSSGDWNVGVKAATQLGDTNLLFAANWDHRSELDTNERDFTYLPYSVNPAPWSLFTNVGTWIPRATFPTAADRSTYNNGSSAEWGSALGFVPDFTGTSCNAIGGIVYNSNAGCQYNYISYYNLVDQTEYYRVYAQADSDLTDRVHFYARVNWARQKNPHSYGSPSQPITRGPAQTTGITSQFYVPATNPYAAEFATRSGWDQSALYGITRGYTAYYYRAFAHGGNDTFSEGSSHSTPNNVDLRFWHFSTGVNGSFANDISFDVAATFNEHDYWWTTPDVIGYRFQQALYGFGGPDCSAPDLDPERFGTQNTTIGTDAASRAAYDCYYWNPFASNFKQQPMRHYQNPSYGGSGYENPAFLQRWIFDLRERMETAWSWTLDGLLSGATPLELGGGALTWAAGVQFRDSHYKENAGSPLYSGEQACAWPEQAPAYPGDANYTGCTPDEPGPFTFFGTLHPEVASRDELSYFVEFDLPILDNLYLIAAARYEEFSGGLDTTVTKVSFKWDVTDHFSLRGSYGDNYQAPPITVVPGDIAHGVNSYTISAGAWKGVTTITLAGIKPETATVWSLGGIWQSEGFTDGSSFRFIADYFNIETKDELGFLATANDIAGAVFHIPADGVTSKNDGTNLADCSHALISRVELEGGACVQGTSRALDMTNVIRDYGNGPGQLVAGYDVSMTYGMPAFAGEVEFGLTATIVDKFEFTATVLDGYTIDPGEDRLGYLNFATIAQAAPEQRANFSVNYAQGIHNVRMVVNYISGVDDERGPVTPAGYQPGTTSTPFTPTSYGVKGDDWVSEDVHYHGDYSFGTVSLSIINITDEDPPKAREELGYDPFMGSPLGRVFQLGWKKQF